MTLSSAFRHVTADEAVSKVLLSLVASSRRVVSADHLICGAAAGLPAGDAAVRAVAAAVCGQESAGGGAAACGGPEGEGPHHGGLSQPEPAGHQAGKSHVQR